MTPIIRRFVIKLLSKDQGSGITKLPNQMQAGFQESMVTEKLVRGGYDPRIIKSETELKMILNRIDASKKQTKEQKDKAMKQLATIMDMKGRKIPQGSKIMGGEAMETEAEIAARMNRENKEAVARMLQKNKMKEVYGDKADDMIEAMKSPGAQKSYKIMQDDLGVKLYGDESFEEIMEIRKTGKHPRGEPEEGLAYGGRAGFMAGGMGRRAFLKMMAAGGAGIAGLKSGLINIFKPRSQAVNEVVETVAKSDAMGMPEHFMPLVNKIMKEGKLTKESDRIQTYKHPTRKDIELDYELDTGSVGVRFDNDQGLPADYYLRKSPPDEGAPRGGIDEFFDGEMVYRAGPDGSYTKGFEEGISGGTTNLDEFVGMKAKDANKAKFPSDVVDPMDEFASGGIARMLGE
jgi:hypothetical protein